ncbi:MAG: hypothetical protein RLZZ522_675, partial [Verrucomicrobiota bacterium]
ELKYTLSNAPATTLQATLAKHQGQRHFIERNFQKSTDPLLNTRDVVQILDWYFRSNPTLESVVEQIERRHHRRKRASASKFKTAAENEKKIRKTILTV